MDQGLDWSGVVFGSLPSGCLRGLRSKGGGCYGLPHGLWPSEVIANFGWEGRGVGWVGGGLRERERLRSFIDNHEVTEGL